MMVVPWHCLWQCRTCTGGPPGQRCGGRVRMARLASAAPCQNPLGGEIVLNATSGASGDLDPYGNPPGNACAARGRVGATVGATQRRLRRQKGASALAPARTYANQLSAWQKALCAPPLIRAQPRVTRLVGLVSGDPLQEVPKNQL